MQPEKHVLPVIVFAQFACISLWFATNGVMESLLVAFDLAPSALGHLTSGVQFGFILGTLLFAFLAIADRFPATRVFFTCAVAGAIANVLAIYPWNTLGTLIALRIATGVCLAGIYPVGMKIAAEHFPKGLGKAMGYLLGALVLGTAFPHLARAFLSELPWRSVIIATSVLSITGGLVLFLSVRQVGSSKKAMKLYPGAVVQAFRDRRFRAAAYGYFGHMWELYAFWAFVPVLIVHYSSISGADLPVSVLSFIIIGVGALSCVAGGYMSLRVGSARVALYALFLSGLCCLVSPLLFGSPLWLFLPVLVIWGIAVIPDSPQFSTLVAQSAPEAMVGSALTMVNCIGFSISIVSIQLVTWMLDTGVGNWFMIVLIPGPVAGAIALSRGFFKTKQAEA